MDFMANKALLIAVGVFITLALTSGVLMVIDNIRIIYSQVYETDTNITSNFSEFDKYDGSEFLGIDLKNTYKKYKDNNIVNVYYGDTLINDNNVDSISNETKLKSTLVENGDIKEIHFSNR